MHWKISTKLIGLAFAGVVGSIALLGWLSVTHGTAALLEQQTDALEAVRKSRQRYIENYFEIIREQIFNFAQDEMIVEAATRLSAAFQNLPAQAARTAYDGAAVRDSLARYYEAEFRPRLEASGRPWRGTQHYIPESPSARILQALYIADNPHAVGSKHRLDAADAPGDYNRLHRHYHPRIRDFLESFGYYDIFLFDLEGNLIYSVFKETDFATNFLTGPYRETNFAEVYREAASARAPAEIAIRDFAAYEPSYGSPASFIGSAVFAGDRKVGVAIFQMPVDKINRIMSELAGLGETGETYLIGSDRLMRSDSRFSDSSTILATEVESEAARRALAGESGTLRQRDYRGVEVLSSYGPLEIPGLGWAMLAEVDMAEITAPAVALRDRIVVIGLVLASAVGLITLFFLRRVVIGPVERLVRGTQRVEGGDYDTQVRIHSADELGELARAFNRMTASIASEIAERVRAEEGLKRARVVAEEANLAKSAFLANMSHELRTPMNAIIGYSEMLMEEAADLGHEDFLPDLKKIHAAGRHLLELINSVLDLSKIEAGKMELYLETFEVDALLDDVIGTVDALVRKKHNRLEVVRADGLGSIRADQTKVRQVLFNLISNAAKFTENGTITLSAERERSEGGDRLRFGVADTGIGIAADKLGEIFDEFTQADTSTTRRFGGTGLGLAISRRFCQMMGGDVRAESEPGAGTSFTVLLPAEVAEQPTPAPAVSVGLQPDQVQPGRCILVIDDDPTARELMARSLSREGFEVVTAASGDEGLAAARESRPAAITLDVMMPGKDGWAVLRELKADPALNPIPVIMVTMVDDQSMGYTLGATEYLTKPVDRGQLSQILQKYRCAHPPCPVLLVEDDAEIRELMRRSLEKEGWRVSEAENGQVALERVSEAIPELIILDLMMPVMDGFQFLVELRKVEGWQSIPVVVVTAKDLTEADRRQLDGSVASVLQKGAYDREQLLAQVRELVASYRSTPREA